MRYFYGSFLVTFLGLLGGAALGWEMHGTMQGVLTTVFIVAVLGDPRGLALVRQRGRERDRAPDTWTRSGAAASSPGASRSRSSACASCSRSSSSRSSRSIGPIAAIILAATDPDEYSRILTSAHVSVSAFGGAFLAMVGLKHFFDNEKDVHWIAVIERPLTKLGRIEAVELGLVMLLLWGVGRVLPEHEQTAFLIAGHASGS